MYTIGDVRLIRQILLYFPLMFLLIRGLIIADVPPQQVVRITRQVRMMMSTRLTKTKQ